MNGFLKKERATFKEIFNRIKKRDFSGSEGLEIKNSFFIMLISFVAKIGALIFTIIVARLLMPELFGLYSIVLAVIMTFVLFSDLGIGDAIVRFISKELGRNRKAKAKSYAIYFLRIKVFLIFVTAILLIIFSSYLSNDVFNKPIFLGLIAGALYLIIIGISDILEGLLSSTNSFKNMLWKESIFQTLRIILVPILIILGLNYSFSNEVNISLVILGLTGSLFFASLLVYIISKKKFYFFKSKKEKLTKNDGLKINKFLIAMPSIAISGLFFGEIDILFLGYFVLSEFVGYYRAVLGLIVGVTAMVTFSAALLPVFSRLNKREIDKDFNKFLNITYLLSGVAMIFVLIFAPLIISIVYGQSYAVSSNLLRIFSLAIISTSIIALYETYFISIGKPKIIASLLIFSTLFNVILTYFLITKFLVYGHLFAVYGAIIASIISRYVVMFGLIFYKNKKI